MIDGVRIVLELGRARAPAVSRAPGRATPSSAIIYSWTLCRSSEAGRVLADSHAGVALVRRPRPGTPISGSRWTMRHGRPTVRG